MNFTTFCFSFGHCCMAHGILLPIQFSSVAQSCPTLCDSMNRSTPGLSVHHQLPESTQTHVHQVADANQPSHPLLSPSPPAFHVSSWPAYRFLRRQVRWSGIPISSRISQFVVINTVKGFSIVNEAEVGVLWEFSCLFYDPPNVGNLISGSSTFSISSLNI